jgi:hypothetical protein
MYEALNETSLDSQTHARNWHDRHNRDCCGGDVCRPKLVTADIEEAIEGIGLQHSEVDDVIQERESVYGPPSVNLDCIARHWQAYLDNRNPGPLTLQDVCNMMCLAKLSRMARTPEHADSVKDIKAYRQIAETTT